MGNKLIMQKADRRGTLSSNTNILHIDSTAAFSSKEERQVDSPHKPVMTFNPQLDPANRPPFSEEQKLLVRESWNIIQEDIARVGVVMFIGLFDTHPEVQDKFLLFRNLTTEEMKQNAQLRTHALRVMGTVEKALARLDQPSKLIDMLHQLGHKHATYTVKPEYIDLIGPQFVQAIKPTMKDHFTAEVDDAWLALFNFVSYVVKEAMIL